MTQPPIPATRPQWPELTLAFGILAAFYALILSGGYQANLGVQVHYLWDNGIRLSNWYAPRPEGLIDNVGNDLIVTESHRLRYALTYPLFLLAEGRPFSPDDLYTLLVPILAVGTCLLCLGSAAQVAEKRIAAWAVLAVVPLGGLFFAMDGRLIFAFFGYALVLRAMLADASGLAAKLMGLTIGIIFASVSSGTMLSALGLVALLSVWQARAVTSALDRLVALAPIFYAVLVFHHDISVAVFKNVAYYGGGLSGVVSMLDHGLGRVMIRLAASPGWALIGGVIGGLGLAGLFRTLRRLNEPLFPMIVLLAAALGLFGYSTLSLVSIPISAWAVLLINRRVARP